MPTKGLAVMDLTRRTFLQRCALTGVVGASAYLGGSSCGLLSSMAMADEPISEEFVPVSRVTPTTGFHWFGYYDKFQFDQADRFLLCNRVDFEHRSPTGDDKIDVGMVDLNDGDRWIPLGESRAWGWQQGCMLQWLPQAPKGNANQEVLWNDREGDKFVARVKDIVTGQTRTLSRPVYTISPDGRWGLSIDFARLNNLRPGYGYAGIADTNLDVKAPDDVGIWRVDLQTGDSSLLLSINQVASIAHQGKDVREYWNWFNHLLINQDGSRFIFLHRWRERYDPRRRQGSDFITRMFTVNADGTDLYMLDPSGFTSHFIWRDPQHVCAWTRPAGKRDGFFLLKDHTQEVEQVGQGVMLVNGHNTYVPQTENEWILNDTYPQGSGRIQTVYLYHVPSNRKIDLAKFHSPSRYQGEWRCDTHPRSSRDGRKVAVDSPHGGAGRQNYVLDISRILG